MRNLKPNEQSILERICMMDDKKLLKLLNEILAKRFKKTIATNDYLFAQGDAPILLVAHLDTVFNPQPTNIFYDTRKNVMWSSEGLGADDRAGVFAILQIIQSGLRPSVLFLMGEESGGIGVSAFVKAHSKPTDNFKYIVELDRRGSNDCVFYNCDNIEFEEYVESFGFVTNFGTFTDISILCPVWKIAGVNLSVGYENEHSYRETLYISALLDTIKKVKTMIQQINESNSFEYVEYFKSYNKFTFPSENDDYFDFKVKCKSCGKYFSDFDVFPVKGLNDSIVYYCPDCMDDNKVHWCKRCQEPYEINKLANDNGYCEDCNKDILK